MFNIHIKIYIDEVKIIQKRPSIEYNFMFCLLVTVE